MHRKCRILLIDNDHNTAELIQKMVSRAGCEVTVVYDEQEAINALSIKPFDVVISETKLPGLNGTELLTKSKERKGNVPIVFLTAYGEVESYLELMNMGAFEYINKPVEEEEILRVLRQALDAYEGSQGVCR